MTYNDFKTDLKCLTGERLCCKKLEKVKYTRNIHIH